MPMVSMLPEVVTFINWAHTFITVGPCRTFHLITTIFAIANQQDTNSQWARSCLTTCRTKFRDLSDTTSTNTNWQSVFMSVKPGGRYTTRFSGAISTLTLYTSSKKNCALPGALRTNSNLIQSIRLVCLHQTHESLGIFWEHCPPNLPQLDSMQISGQFTPTWMLLPFYHPSSSLVKWKKLVFRMEGYRSYTYGRDFFGALYKHARTLEVLRLEMRAYVMGDRVDRLMLLAPNLKELYILGDYMDGNGGYLDARELVKADWVCTDLEVFACRIRNIPRFDITRPIGRDFGRERVQQNQDGTLEESIELQRQVYSKLARFTRLRELQLGFPVNSRTSYYKHRRDEEKYRQYDCLAMTLESGLDLLRGLKDLSTVGLEDMEVYIHDDKKQTWFAEHWPHATFR
ncbi:hypothetical protein BG015_004733 [Linnemannia schmuckeri]|uniref:Uncharacterized protein n=1 Tax=Linnemannia schmuckeri TaxID=64567 RepID=A0A9P5S1L1_9FUNG|nr:hypothetical protein BG015_004733 [Linnemannia schmuckeri]